MARQGEDEDRRDGARGPIGGRRRDDPHAVSDEDWDLLRKPDSGMRRRKVRAIVTFHQRGQFDIEIDATEAQMAAIKAGGTAGWDAKIVLETAAIVEWERLEMHDLDTDFDTELFGIEPA